MNIIFLDLETTGLDVNNGDKIIEIACLKLENNIKSIFHFYLNPLKKVSLDAYKIHGISDNFLKNKFFFKNIVFEFINFIKNSILIIHNAIFDIGFLNSELNLLKFKNIENYCFKILDTLKLSKKIYNNKRNSLEFLCKRFNIDYSLRIKHGALIDVKLLYKVYLNLKHKINRVKTFKNHLKKKKKKNNFINNKIFINLNYKEKLTNNYFFNRLI